MLRLLRCPDFLYFILCGVFINLMLTIVTSRGQTVMTSQEQDVGARPGAQTSEGGCQWEVCAEITGFGESMPVI